MNKQKTLHGAIKPTGLRKGRIAKQCRSCSQWFSLPVCHAPQHQSCSVTCARARSAEKIESRRTNCIVCKKSFIPRIYQLTHGGGRFCSVKCSGVFTIPTMHSPPARIKARRSFMKALRTGSYVPAKGPDNPSWLGVKMIDGYRWIWVKGRGYAPEHHLVMEAITGRKIKKGEVVHHRNRDRADNRPSNLAVMTRAEHMDEHRPDIVKNLPRGRRCA